MTFKREVKSSPKTGQVLLAEPFMDEPTFKRTAILLTDHSDEGSVGFILNRPLDCTLDHVSDTFPEFEGPVYYGGPVANNTLHYLHCRGDIIEGSVEVTKGLFWGGDLDKLKFYIGTKVISSRDIKFFIGYSGWSSGQLQEELDRKSWVLANMDLNYFYKSESHRLWNQILNVEGGTKSILAQISEHNTWN